MNTEEFKRALLYGFGSAVTFVRSNAVSEEYQNIIIDYSIHNYLFDPQCEGDRARYLWDIISACPNFERLQVKIMRTLELMDSSIYHYQIYKLGVLFAHESSYNPIENS